MFEHEEGPVVKEMDFLKCWIAGTAYGSGSSEVELAAARQTVIDLAEQENELSNFPCIETVLVTHRIMQMFVTKV